MKKFTRAALAALLLVSTFPALAGAPEVKEPQAGAPELSIAHERYTLDNGLEVILHQDRRLPLAAVSVWYHVAAYHEVPGRSGFAHLFEHMMFQGSAHVGDDQHIKMLQELGATGLNGTTSFDRTNYFETVPSHHLETALWLEADRMGFLLQTLTEEKLATQIEVVKNERRQSTETAPYGLAEEKVFKALFPAPHPYNGVVIGSMEDLGAATLDDVRSFFTTWYAPSNATLALAGDFEIDEAKALVQKYFGTLPKAEAPAQPEVAPVAIEAPVVIHHDEPVATLPKLFIAWHSPKVFAPGDAEADVLMQALSGTESGRLRRRLVRELQLAQSAQAYQYSLGAQSIFGVEVTARPGVTTDQLLEATDALFDELRAEGITQKEVTRALNGFETDFVSKLQMLGGFGGRADQLQRYNHFTGQSDYLATDLARYRAVTPAGVAAFVKTWLDPNKRVIVHAVPPAPEAAAPATETEAK